MNVKRFEGEKIMRAAAAMGTKVYACYHEKKKSPKKHTKTLFKKLSLKNYTKAGYTGRCRETPVSECVFTELVSLANNSYNQTNQVFAVNPFLRE